MARLDKLVRDIFRRSHTRFGHPTMSVVPPMASWTLPAGYVFDEQTDTIRTASGARVEGMEFNQTPTVLDIVPSSVVGHSQENSLAALGILSEGLLEVVVLKDDYTTVKNAFAVQVDGEWYDVAGLVLDPPGQSVWVRVRLQRRS